MKAKSIGKKISVTQLFKKVTKINKNGTFSEETLRTADPKQLCESIIVLCNILEEFSIIRNMDEFRDFSHWEELVNILAKQCSNIDRYVIVDETGAGSEKKWNNQNEWFSMLCNDRIRPVISWLEGLSLDLLIVSLKQSEK